MRKLQLDVSELKVESFETSDAAGERGTVHGHVSPRCVTNYTCNPANNTCGEVESCGAWPSCYVSCDTACPVAECQGGGGTLASNCSICQTEPLTFCLC